MQTRFKSDGVMFFDILEEVIEKEKTTVETVVGFGLRDKEEREVIDSASRKS